MKLSRRKDGANGESPPHEGTCDTLAAGEGLGLPDGMQGLRAVMDRLLADDGGCPWDRAQTLESLRPYLVEETYEVLESMDDPAEHRGELGDLLFQIVFQAALRQREGSFDLDDVIAEIRDKLIRRHPHVFGAAPPLHSASDVERQWERIKQVERGAQGPRDPLAGVPRALPPLERAGRLQDKATAVGFDWPDVQGAIAKFHEEWGELEEARAADDREAMQAELGDLLFVLVRVAQKLGLDAEDALRGANAKFERRFARVMEQCHAQGVDPAAAGLERLEAMWQAAKLEET
jgi:MazG family protein